MIDNSNAPKWWRYDHRVHCAAHAEARFGAGLYRDPRPTDRGGNAPQPSHNILAERCPECAAAAWDVVA